MQELTREQEAKIASMAIDHGSVKVTPRDDGTVRIDFGTYGPSAGAVVLDADGNDVAGDELMPTVVSLSIPIDVVKELIGVERVNEVIEGAHARHGIGNMTVPFAIGSVVQDEFVRVLRSMVLA